MAGALIMDEDGGGLPKAREAAWLTSSHKWRTSLGKGWTGTKLLGRGSFGVAGLWKYSGTPAPAVTEIVVKQTLLGSDEAEEDDLNEGKHLSLLALFGSKHILRIYGPIRRDVFDERKVLRLFLEYCPGKDLSQFTASMSEANESEDDGDDDDEESPDDNDSTDNNGFKREPGAAKSSTNGNEKPALSEADIWAMFHCLALGVSVMDHGSESDIMNPNLGGQLAHNDIKLDNILLGYRGPEHERYPILKIADFGDAILILPGEQQIDDPVPDQRGNVNWQPPEQYSVLPGQDNTALEHPRKGTCSNVFQVGCVMHSLITRKQKKYSKPVRYISNLNDTLLKGYTHGVDMESDEYDEYSRTLRELVMECMMRESLHRPTSGQLKTRTSAGLTSALAAAQDDDGSHGSKGMVHVPYREIDTDQDPPAEWLLPDPPVDDEDTETDTNSEGSSGSPDEDDYDEGNRGRKRKLDGEGDGESEVPSSQRQKTSSSGSTVSSDDSELSDAPDTEDEDNEESASEK